MFCSNVVLPKSLRLFYHGDFFSIYECPDLLFWVVSNKTSCVYNGPYSSLLDAWNSLLDSTHRLNFLLLKGVL